MKFSEKAYSGLLDRIFAITPSVQNAGFTGSSYKPGLDGMKRFDALLGHPWQSFRTIHVAGTNGKGSVSSMLASVLASAPAGSSPIPGKEFWKRPGSGGLPSGAAIGLYTSPHLMDFRERMKVVTDDGWTMPSKEEVWEFFRTFDTAGLSFFEMTTGLAFWWFRRQKVDLAVIEAGLGGRLDSTNIITPDLSVITSIGLDHCALLGNTRAEIAAEKAGIFKPGVPALCGQRDAETAPVFEARANGVHCPLFFAEDFQTDLFDTDLTGPYQAANLRTALAAMELLGVAPDREALAATAARTGLRGRWEQLCSDPEVICDIGHNPPALEINFRRLRQSGRPLLIVYGIMADKDLDAIRPMMPPDARYFLVAPRGARALPAEVLADRMRGLDRTVCGSVENGVHQALDAAKDIPGCILYIGGSNFVVAEAIRCFEPE